MKIWLRRWRHRQRRMKHSLRDTYIHRILGERIFHRHIWAHDMSSVAGGLSLGIFIAFTPTIPLQMLLCVIASLYLRVNLPISLTACWITNPVTAVPIYWAAHRLGEYLLEHSGLKSFIMLMFPLENRTSLLIEYSFSLWTGSLIFAVIAATMGNIAVRVVWNQARKLMDRT